MADGEVIFRTELDNKALYRDLDKTVKDIDRLDGKISKLGAQKIPLEEKLQRITGELDEAKAVLADMRAAPKGTYEKVDIADAHTVIHAIVCSAFRCTPQAQITQTAIVQTGQRVTFHQKPQGALHALPALGEIAQLILQSQYLRR